MKKKVLKNFFSYLKKSIDTAIISIFQLFANLANRIRFGSNSNSILVVNRFDFNSNSVRF